MRKKDLADKLLEIVNEEYEKLRENNNFSVISKYANVLNAAAICTTAIANARPSRWGSSASKKKF